MRLQLNSGAGEIKKKYSVDYKVQHKKALEIAEESAVLLENDGMLPLKKQKIMIIGELAEFMKFQGGGSSHITTAEYPDAVKAFENLGYEVVYEKGYWSGFCADRNRNKKNLPLKKRALKTLEILCDNDSPEKGLPVLFFCGLTEKFEGEGFDRISLDLPEEQLELLDEILKTTKNVAVINFSGSPVVFPFRKDVRALLHMYLCGEAAGEAVASIVSGRTSPSGRLAETFPLKVEDIPCHKNFAPEGDNVCYREGVFVGYRHYLSRGIDVEYEFGFGKSYASFEYYDFTATEKSARVKIKNTGGVDSCQVVQIYALNPMDQRNERPEKELIGFTKVFVKAGETVQTEISFDEYAFCVYSPVKKSFVKIKAGYGIQLCESLTNVKSSVKVNVGGDELCNVLQKVDEKFYEEKKIASHRKGSFTLTDSLGDMAAGSKFVAGLFRFVEKVMVMTSRNKSAEDPAVKIALAALRENPLESLISTSGGALKLKYAEWILRKANKVHH